MYLESRCSKEFYYLSKALKYMLVKKNSLIKIKFLQGFKCSYFLSFNVYFCQLKRSIPIIGIYKNFKIDFQWHLLWRYFQKIFGKTEARRVVWYLTRNYIHRESIKWKVHFRYLEQCMSNDTRQVNIYVESPALSRCHLHFWQLTCKNMLFDIICIVSKSTALKPMYKENKKFIYLASPPIYYISSKII